METEIPGTAVLLNLSLLAITFAAVSALVMLVRQTMGGSLSNFDVYLITSYVAFGFAIAVGATLPAVLVLYDLRPTVLWAIASSISSVLLGGVVTGVVTRRHKATSVPMSYGVMFSILMQGLAIAILVVNATIPAIQGSGVYVGALTLSLAIIMWGFVRRVSSLLGDKPGEDWDPKRG